MSTKKTPTKKGKPPPRKTAITKPSHPTAVVLTGGGAHGAYEAGVLQFLFGEFLNREAGPGFFQMFAGTSAGALNACTMASMAHDPWEGAHKLVDYWRSVSMDRILRFGLREMRRLPSVIIGGQMALDFLAPRPRAKKPKGAPHPPIAGVFDTSPLFQEMSDLIPWTLLKENLQKGLVRGIALCATEVCTSRSVIFYQLGKGGVYREGSDTSKEERHVQIGVEHAMASASIPFLFPAVQIDGVCYMDGALRQNIPFYPAVRMEAERILVISLSREASVKYRTARKGCRRNPYPGLLFLLGRTVRAVMDGILDEEIQRAGMFNRIIEEGRALCGAGFITKLNEISREFRNAEYRPVRTYVIRPSRDLKELAVEAIRESPHEMRMPGIPGRIVREVLASSPLVESELASFLMFVPTFTRKLVRLGYEDAASREKELIRFFRE